MVCSVFALFGQSKYEQLIEFNPQWKIVDPEFVNGAKEKVKSDQELVGLHLKYVLRVLRSADTEGLSPVQLVHRKEHIQVLDKYQKRGRFPVNFYREERIPVFIDQFNTHCAVGYLLKESNREELAQSIAQANNYAWVRELADNKELIAWQQESGLSIEELKLIQGAYDFYMPRALELPNRYEIPQKPDVICEYFDDSKKLKEEDKEIWLRGEGKNGVLNGNWEQNYEGGFPWIRGYFEDGLKSGQWFEYYPGSERLCRTEHWRNDKLNGIRTRYDRDGNIIEEILFKDGIAITKTNYDLFNDRKYIRVPIDSNRVQTQIWSLTGAILAQGVESIYNPGNLQWFQNIELTALNTAAISAQQISITNTGVFGGRSFDFFKPPLVEYHKEGEWSFYRQYNNQSAVIVDHGLQGSIRHYYGEFAPIFSDVLVKYDEKLAYDLVDSIHGVFDDNYLTWMRTYGQMNYTTLGVEYNEPNYHLDTPNEIFLGQIYGSQPMHLIPIKSIKSIGRLDQNHYRIGVWKSFNEQNKLIKMEQYYVPMKPEEIEEKEMKNG